MIHTQKGDNSSPCNVLSNIQHNLNYTLANHGKYTTNFVKPSLQMMKFTCCSWNFLIWYSCTKKKYLSASSAGPSPSFFNLHFINAIPGRISSCYRNRFVQFIHLPIKKAGLQQLQNEVNCVTKTKSHIKIFISINLAYIIILDCQVAQVKVRWEWIELVDLFTPTSPSRWLFTYSIAQWKPKIDLKTLQ